MLDQLPIRLLGVLLNDVQPGEMYGYYSYTYAGGYAAVDEGSVRRSPAADAGRTLAASGTVAARRRADRFAPVVTPRWRRSINSDESISALWKSLTP